MFSEVESIDDSFTLSFSFEKEGWVSFHNYVPDFIYNLRNNQLFSYKDGNLYEHNVGDYGVFYGGEKHLSFIQPTFTMYGSKPINTVTWVTETGNRNKTFSSIEVKNSFQSTSDIKLVPIDDSCSLREQYGKYNIRRIDSNWFFNDIKDFSEACKGRKQPLIDDYCIVKLVHDNTTLLKYYSININENR